MASNIKIVRICEYCGNEFTARTTVTRFCSHTCNSRAYKANKKNQKIERSNKETIRIKNEPIEEIQVKEFLTVKEVSILLNCSTKTIHRLINDGKIKAVKISERKTMVRKADLNILFNEEPKILEKPDKPTNFDDKDYFTISDVRHLYNISEKGVRNTLKNYNIPKYRQGVFTYVPKDKIIELFGEPKGN